MNISPSIWQHLTDSSIQCILLPSARHTLGLHGMQQGNWQVYLACHLLQPPPGAGLTHITATRAKGGSVWNLTWSCYYHLFKMWWVQLYWINCLWICYFGHNIDLYIKSNIALVDTILNNRFESIKHAFKTEGLGFVTTAQLQSSTYLKDLSWLRSVTCHNANKQITREMWSYLFTMCWPEYLITLTRIHQHLVSFSVIKTISLFKIH